MRSRRALWRRMSAGLLGALGAGLVLAAPRARRRARRGSRTSRWPPGTAQVGQELRARDADWRGDEPMDVAWTWARCTSQERRRLPRRSTAPTRSPTARRRPTSAAGCASLLVLSNRSGNAWAISGATAAVAAAPGAGPRRIPTPGAHARADARARRPAPTPPTPGAVVTPLIPTLMQPFPVIRIRGKLTPGGARVTLLTVKAPRGASISLRCFGRSCPVQRVGQDRGGDAHLQRSSAGSPQARRSSSRSRGRTASASTRRSSSAAARRRCAATAACTRAPRSRRRCVRDVSGWLLRFDGRPTAGAQLAIVAHRGDRVLRRVRAAREPRDRARPRLAAVPESRLTGEIVPRRASAPPRRG